jgi:hypothetical protein
LSDYNKIQICKSTSFFMHLGGLFDRLRHGQLHN